MYEVIMQGLRKSSQVTRQFLKHPAGAAIVGGIASGYATHQFTQDETAKKLEKVGRTAEELKETLEAERKLNTRTAERNAELTDELRRANHVREDLRDCTAGVKRLKWMFDRSYCFWRASAPEAGTSRPLKRDEDIGKTSENLRNKF